MANTKIDSKAIHAVMEKMVHFNGKTINSKIPPLGIRLAPDSALDLPYLSLRTILNPNMPVQLDAIEGGAHQAELPARINKILVGKTRDALPEEEEAVKEGISLLQQSYSKGIDTIDYRLRQILVPKGESYVSLTPLSSSSLCALLFDKEQGLIHTVKLRRARFGLGGGHIQNIGVLAATMQYPLFLKSPRKNQERQRAYYHSFHGIQFSLFSPSPFREAVLRYHAFKKKTRSTRAQERRKEESYILQIAQAVLAMAQEAKALLQQYGLTLSPKISKAIRALFYEDLRYTSWARDLADLLIEKMQVKNTKGERLFLLSPEARADFETLLAQGLDR